MTPNEVRSALGWEGLDVFSLELDPNSTGFGVVVYEGDDAVAVWVKHTEHGLHADIRAVSHGRVAEVTAVVLEHEVMVTLPKGA